ncbi:hypothetical protein LK07_02755 [Streptomyces pluripotens]|uniref:Uncharacterized protein n=1 Tax=Streptomyces pluripotens TaxID=1355015 RepID=A0A221NT86_9ACTN|nr:hypothetical protein LK06_001675 [Streptomyces pluripotens]ASN23122.1 hypothetical protein LK07_02755 [Streptomyces pluripotens]
MKTLTPEHRDAPALVYTSGTRVTDAARAPGAPPGTVKSRAFYAPRTLRRTPRRTLRDHTADLQ